MHDTLGYMAQDPIHRKYQQHRLTFRRTYAFSESFVLPFSHDEVVHGKGSLLDRMAGQDRDRFANLRLLFGYTLRPAREEAPLHGRRVRPGAGVEPRPKPRLAPARDRPPRRRPALGAGPQSPLQDDAGPLGARQRSAAASSGSTAATPRTASSPCCAREGRERPTSSRSSTSPPWSAGRYRLGVPQGGFWREHLNSDASCYGGSGLGNLGGVVASPVPAHGRPFSLELTLPPLAALFLICEPSTP